ncbi:MAG: monomethylamine permease [Methanosarcinaceae archaeon]|nr:monomethylamine permease [Methanosarcinaceae archaeon]MDD4497250.1 monomethylamine permease [Methanosarcinaceae archaeon]
MSLEMTSELESKYHSKLKGDSLMILGMLALLIGVETFVIGKVLSATWEISSGFSYLYIVFVGLVVGIEAIGCLRVRDSIRNHMFEFRYYD